MAKAETTPWIAWYWTDWIADTTHLGHSEKGIYMALLEVYYQHGKPITRDLDKLYYAVRATTPESQKAVRYILEEYFFPGEFTEGADCLSVWRHKRADRELHEAIERHAAAVKRAKNAAEARWGKQPEINQPPDAPSNASSNAQACPQAMLTHNPQPTTRTYNPQLTTTKASSAPSARINTIPTWSAYAEAYQNRYHTEPVRNAKVNTQVLNFVKRIGIQESPHVAAFYVANNNRYYVEKMHQVSLLLNDAEKLRTEWATHRQVTSTQAAQTDKTQTNYNAFAPMIAEAREREKHEKAK